MNEVCGLDYGWGPTAFMEFCIDHIHILCGLGWAASISATAMMIRAVIFRFSMKASEQSAKMSMMQPIIKPLTDKMREARATQDTAKMVQIKRQLDSVKKEHGMSMIPILLPVLIQVPLQYGGFRLYRGMTSLPVPAFESEKWLWTSDLTQSDPFFIMPLVSGGLLYWNLRVCSVTGPKPPCLAVLLTGLRTSLVPRTGLVRCKVA